MFSFSCSPRNQSPNQGRKAGKKKRTYRYPAKSAKKVLPTIAEEDYIPEPQVTPPFPSHPTFGGAHPPVVGGYGPYTPTGSDVLFNSLPCNQSFSNLLYDSDTMGRGSSPSTLDFSVRTNLSKRCLELYSKVCFLRLSIGDKTKLCTFSVKIFKLSKNELFWSFFLTFS